MTEMHCTCQPDPDGCSLWVADDCPVHSIPDEVNDKACHECGLDNGRHLEWCLQFGGPPIADEVDEVES